jgi:valyl-tRNA synthetase
MSLSKRYDPQEAEPRLQSGWQRAGIYHFLVPSDKPVYSIDTPPPTVSGHLHLGHCYSYTHPDLIARFWRMRGYNVFYPMGYDDNGLPTERLVERRFGILAAQIGRGAFIEKCLQVSEETEVEYQALWQRLGLSVDWRYNYRSVDAKSRRVSQLSFIYLYRQGLAYRQKSPAIWCPECRTSIAQAELNDLERTSEFVTLRFSFDGAGGNPGTDYLPIATTRPELLPACVAVFVHPQDPRYRGISGRYVIVPLFGQRVPILEDAAADPQKGTGAVMCCTFGDATDVSWWNTYHLPLVEAVGRDGRLTQAAGVFAGLPMEEARQSIKQALLEKGFLLSRLPTSQSVRVHERCDTPVEYILTEQWFIRVLDSKEALLKAGEAVHWHPEHMGTRYRAWVENLNWDWCISRQRYFGVPFPVWYCTQCGETVLADEKSLPVDPLTSQPSSPCPTCGGSSFMPEEDVLDTWATSSMTPQIVGGWLDHLAGLSEATDERTSNLYSQVFPFSLRPQAHDIIRTWAFYTIVKSHFHFDQLPWSHVLISGWGIAGEGMGKISKSRGGGPVSPAIMLNRYSADAIRYWASSTNPGKDSVTSEEKIQLGAKLVTKLWNVARFSERFIQGHYPSEPPISLSPADRWILSRLQKLIRRVTSLMEAYEYATAKSEIEGYFWQELADNYLEMSKQRLYDEAHPLREGARFALYRTLLTTIKLLAPFLPHITEEIYLGLFADEPERQSIHISAWPVADPALENDEDEATGQRLVEIATAVRRYKSERNLPLGTELSRLQLVFADERRPTDPKGSALILSSVESDLKSITRAKVIEAVVTPDDSTTYILTTPLYQVAIGGD